MSEIGLVEIFSMGEADRINRYAVCYTVFLQKTSTEPVSRYRN